jgi:uncharacterized membrane protein
MQLGKFAGAVASATLLLLSALALSGCGRGGDGESSGPGGGDNRPAITEEEIQAKAQGMLAALGAPATPDVKAQYAGEFEAAGAEPDWSATILADYVLFTRPGLDEINAIPKPRDVRAQGVYVDAEPLILTVRAGQCTYGEGGEAYPFSATVLFEGVAYEGCARSTANASQTSKSWADALSQYLPAIDACLARVEAKPGRVTIAYPGEEGQTSVRLIEADGGRSECSVGPDGTSVASVEPLADRNVVAGERDPLFTRAPTQPPQGRCYKSETVPGSNGAAIGYLSRKTC